MAIFLFLEIRDAPVVKVLGAVRAALKGKESSSPIHITLRGPYVKNPERRQIDNFLDVLSAEGVLLSGIGHFDFADRRVVYLKANSKVIRGMWWKPDFPIERYGFNPHITLFEGPTREASIVEKFLKQEKLELWCTDLSLRLYDTKQVELFNGGISLTEISNVPKASSVLMNPHRWTPGIEQRAAELRQRIISDR